VSVRGVLSGRCSQEPMRLGLYWGPYIFSREAGIIMLQVVARGLDTTMARLLRGL
jgi:hypothetical protein